MVRDAHYRAKLAFRARGLADLARHAGGIEADIERRLAARGHVRILELGCGYGTALLDFTADRMTILPFKGDPAATSATVRTEVKRSNGTPMPVNYSLRKTPKGWKAWDVTIEGISYVKNFRTDFGTEIDQKGLDAVIQRLESQNSKPVADAKAATAAK